MRPAVILVVLGACAVEPAAHLGAGDQTLSSDAHFIAIPAPYTNLDDCFANAGTPFQCQYAVALCSNGRAGTRMGDLVDEGDYHVEGDVAVGTLRGGDFQLDVATGVGSGQVAYYAWQPDTENRWQTLQWDSIDCSQP